MSGIKLIWAIMAFIAVFSFIVWPQIRRSDRKPANVSREESHRRLMAEIRRHK